MVSLAVLPCVGSAILGPAVLGPAVPPPPPGEGGVPLGLGVDMGPAAGAPPGLDVSPGPE